MPICGRRTVKSVDTPGANAFKSSLAETFGSGTKRAGVTKKQNNHFSLVPGTKSYDLKFPPHND